jgi:hypothetical protein
VLADYLLALLDGGLKPPPEGADAHELAAAEEARLAATAGVFRLAEIATLYWQANTKRPGKVSGRRG